jgi:ATP-dependent Zn protease
MLSSLIRRHSPRCTLTLPEHFKKWIRLPWRPASSVDLSLRTMDHYKGRPETTQRHIRKISSQEVHVSFNVRLRINQSTTTRTYLTSVTSYTKVIMNKTTSNISKSNSMSTKFIRTATTLIPWILLVQNFFHMVFGNTSTGKSDTSLASNNFIGLSFLVVVQWASSRGYVSV